VRVGPTAADAAQIALQQECMVHIFWKYAIAIGQPCMQRDDLPKNAVFLQKNAGKARRLTSRRC
jgi:hypothetical protein